MLSFVERIRARCQVADVVDIDLSQVESIDADGVALLLKYLSDERLTQGKPIRGSEPSRPAVLADLIASGFFEYVGSARRIGVKPSSTGVLARKQRTVDNVMASEIVRHASSLLFGSAKRMPSIYSSLIECMANTKNHAAKHEFGNTETWWLAISPSEDRQFVRFAFIDAGIGLFDSVNIRGIRKQFSRLFGLLPNTEILRQLLNGDIDSATGLNYRGKGLPRIKSFLESGKLTRLVIIVNNVYADVGANDYRELRDSFKGTFVYWEAGLKCPAFEPVGGEK